MASSGRWRLREGQGSGGGLGSWFFGKGAVNCGKNSGEKKKGRWSEGCHQASL